jgi:hypothetical protein
MVKLRSKEARAKEEGFLMEVGIGGALDWDQKAI